MRSRVGGTPAPAEHAGLASGVNNAVARAAGLLAVAVLPAMAGLSGDDYAEAAAFDAGFTAALGVSAVVVAAGGLLAALVTSNDVLDQAPAAPRTPHAPHAPQGSETPVAPEAPDGVGRHLSYCGVAAPPLPTATVSSRTPSSMTP